MSLDIRYEVADVVCLRGTSLFSKMILYFTNDTVSHCGIIISTKPLLVMHAVNRVKTLALWDMVSDTAKVYFIHHNHLTEQDRIEIIEEACRLSAKSYSWWKIVLQALDLVGHTDWFSMTLGRSKRPYCSYYVALSYFLKKILFGESYKTVRPDEILAWAQAHTDTYTVTELDLVMPGKLR